MITKNIRFLIIMHYKEKAMSFNKILLRQVITWNLCHLINLLVKTQF